MKNTEAYPGIVTHMMSETQDAAISDRWSKSFFFFLYVRIDVQEEEYKKSKYYSYGLLHSSQVSVEFIIDTSVKEKEEIIIT